MKSKERQIYLTLLRAAIWNRSDERLVISTGEIAGVIQLAAFHGTGPLIYNQLLKIPDLEISSKMRIQMKQQCVSSMMQQQVMMPILLKAWTALEDAGIYPVLLKGLALAQYYPQSYLRHWGDIDLYVGQKQYHQACKILNDVFPEADHPAVDDEERKHYNYVFSKTVLELHRISMGFAHPKDRKYYENLEETYLTKDGPIYEINGQRITTPEDTFNVFFVFLHAWHHFETTGMNVKQLCDIAVLLQAKHNVIDTNRLRRILTQLHLLEVWQLIMYIIVKHLDLSQDKTPFYTIDCSRCAELLFERVLIEGNNRAHSKINADGASYLQRKWLTFQSRIADSQIVKTYAPKYARHKFIGDLLHGIERIMANK